RKPRIDEDGVRLLAFFHSFWKRQKKEMPRAYDYGLPEPLRNQIILACNGAVRRFGKVMVHGDLDLFYSVAKLRLCQEFGLLRLSDHMRTDEEDVWSFFLQEQTVEGCFDIIEIVLACMTQYV